MRRRYLIQGSKNNIVYYTTTDNNTITTPMGAFNVIILSNIYNEVGIITCKGNIKSINYYAFYNYTNLTSIEIPDSVTSIGDNAFDGCSSLTRFKIPNGVTSISYSTFSNCSSLTSIEIPNSVTSIGGGAFSGCTGLTEVTIPNSVTNIDGSAFSSCSSLKSVVIGNSVTSIGDFVFYGCSRLTSVYVKSTTPPTLGNSVFFRSNPKIYVPRASLNAYKTASGWSGYASVIEPYDFDVNLITFYIKSKSQSIECTAVQGMRFYDWILSEYFDTTNPYGIAGANGDDKNIQEFIREYGLEHTKITTGGGFIYAPPIYTTDLIIPNQIYSPNVGDMGY